MLVINIIVKSWSQKSNKNSTVPNELYNTTIALDYVGVFVSPSCCLKTALWSTSSMKPSSIDSLSLSSSSAVPSVGKNTCSCFGPLVGKDLLKHGIPLMDKFSWLPGDCSSFTEGRKPHWLMLRRRAGLLTRFSLGRGCSGREKWVYTGLQASRGLSVLSQGSDEGCFGQYLWENVSHSGLWPGMNMAGSVMLQTFKRESEEQREQIKPQLFIN